MGTTPFYLSRTLWFNALAFIILIANGFGFANFQHDASLDQYALVAVTVINFALRLFTTKPIAISKK